MDPVTKLNVIKERLTTKTRENAENWANVKTRLEQIKKSIDAFRQQQQQPLDNSRQLFQDSSEKISQELVILNKQYQMVIVLRVLLLLRLETLLLDLLTQLTLQIHILEFNQENSHCLLVVDLMDGTFTENQEPMVITLY